MDLRRLAEPFPAADLDWRILQAGLKNGKPWGKCVAYVTNRAIMERLDGVCSPENWCNEFVRGPEGGVLCGISIKCDEEWVKKWDGAENTDVEGVKGGLSGAMKRAAVQWGIGRYLYDLDEGWASFEEGGPLSAKIEGQWFRWSPPSLPAWALPGGKQNSDELAALVSSIREWGARCTEEAEFKVAGNRYAAKAYIRENWSAIKEQYRVARAVVDAIEESTGERLT